MLIFRERERKRERKREREIGREGLRMWDRWVKPPLLSKNERLSMRQREYGESESVGTKRMESQSRRGECSTIRRSPTIHHRLTHCCF